jgi:hypothetical protein
LPEIRVSDDFYPGVSLHRTLRRSPSSVVQLHASILEANGYSSSRENLATILSASKALYRFLSKEGEAEVNEYRSETKGRRPIKGIVVPQFDLVIQILSSVVNYCSSHPGEAIQTAAALAYLEERLEKKLGRVGKRIWRKVLDRKPNSSPRKQVEKLAKITKKRSRPSRARTASSSTHKKKRFKQMKLD